MIIDAHVHISIYQNSTSSLDEAFQQLLLEMRRYSVDYAIIIPDNIEDDPQIAGLDKAQKLITGHNNLFLLGSPQVLTGGGGEVEKYRKFLSEGAVKGLKFFPGHEPYYPTDKRCLPYYQLCEQLTVPLIFHTGINSGHPEVAKYNDPRYIVDVAKQFPGLKIVITHYFWPEMEYCYKVTKDVPNIYFETAAMADEEVIKATGGVDKVKDILLKTINDRPDQVIFGTDWPMCKVEEHIKLVQQLNLPKEIEEKIMSKNAINVYRVAASYSKDRFPG